MVPAARSLRPAALRRQRERNGPKMVLMSINRQRKHHPGKRIARTDNRNRLRAISAVQLVTVVTIRYEIANKRLPIPFDRFNKLPCSLVESNESRPEG